MSFRPPEWLIQTFLAFLWVGLFCVPIFWVQSMVFSLGVGYVVYRIWSAFWTHRPISWGLWFRLQRLLSQCVVDAYKKWILAVFALMCLICTFTFLCSMLGLVASLAYILVAVDEPPSLPTESSLVFFQSLLAMSILALLYKNMVLTWMKTLLSQATVQTHIIEELEHLAQCAEDVRTQKEALLLKKNLSHTIEKSQTPLSKSPRL